jgi:integrase
MWVEAHGLVFRIRDRRAGKVITVETGYRTKKAAKNAMVHLTSDRLRGTDLVPRGGETLLNEWLDAWQPAWEATLKMTTSNSEPSRVRNHIRPLLGDHALKEIDTLAVQQWVAILLKGVRRKGDPEKWDRKPLAAKTVANCHGLLHKIMQGAVAAKLIGGNPCIGTVLPAKQHHEMRFLTEPEIQRLLAAAPLHWRPLILLLVSTGLRWGEAIGLRVGLVDLLAKNPTLRVEEQLQESPGTGEMVWATPKSAKSKRSVTFVKKVAEALAPLVAAKDREDVVFTAPRGGKVRTRNFRRTWLKVCARAGLEGLRIHDLRHTHAAMLIAANVPLTAIQRRLGHSSIAVTSDLYGHLLPVVDENIAVAVNAALAGIDADSLAKAVGDELVDELV